MPNLRVKKDAICQFIYTNHISLYRNVNSWTLQIKHSCRKHFSLSLPSGFLPLSFSLIKHELNLNNKTQSQKALFNVNFRPFSSDVIALFYSYKKNSIASYSTPWVKTQNTPAPNEWVSKLIDVSLLRPYSSLLCLEISNQIQKFNLIPQFVCEIEV